ncbi:MAG: hypothetical protein ACRCT2_05680, partial [Plesiomonas shigelloides]
MPFGGPYTTDEMKYTEDTPYSALPNHSPTSPKSDRTVTFDLANKDDELETSTGTSDLDKVIAENDQALEDIVRDINKEHEHQDEGTQNTRFVDPYIGKPDEHDDSVFNNENLHEIQDSKPKDTGEQQGWTPDVTD